jgi:hypothetical protein
VARNRYDETWHRLREWTKGQTPSERLAAQILMRDGFSDLDPSHPLGGRDGGKDALAIKGGVPFAIAVYFPRGAQAFKNVRSKFESDLAAASTTGAAGFAFVTNQELTLGEREELRTLGGSMAVDLYHLERITAILDAPDMASVRQQFLDIGPEGAASPIFLGGLGGSGPGSGGGGGSAIGSNTRGGKGGPGGDIITLNGTPGSAPGAGGGGAGAIGEGAIAGEGGGGGEHVSATLGPDDLEGVHHFEFQVGQGGVGGPGEDTIVNLCAEDGRVIRKIVAKGGMPGAPPYVPPQSRTPTRVDIDAGMKVTSLLAAEFIRCRDGLWTIVEGGWDWIQVRTNPFRYPLPLYVEIETGPIDAGTVLDLKLVVFRPDGFHVSEREQKIVVEDSAVKRSRFAVALELVGSQPGVWRVQVLAGLEVLGEYPIEVRVPPAGDA